ncbi:L-aspartate oxidase [Chitinispirillum alkaliphilum]|nr:L-aspartate oxidase [Chitinispirillum alkaliphilum]
MNEKSCDFLVIGSGIAGLCYAIHASAYGSVVMITKKHDTESNTNYAQGGIACVLSSQDSFQRHIEDTEVAGCGLCDHESVRILVEEGPVRIKELLQWGVDFSKTDHNDNPYDLHLGKEGGHSANRIVHSKDLTGRELENALLKTVRSLDNVSLYENHMAIELITDHHLHSKLVSRECYGAYVLSCVDKSIFKIRSKITCLATGGAGQVYQHTTNPAIATGDGVAMAYRAGARISNMEFIQFHPTTLYHKDANSFLISEALRGYGATLRNGSGEEFMNKYHKSGVLAPRDVVARAIDNEMKISAEPCVYLDVTHKPASQTRDHFPNIYNTCLRFGIDITKDLIPVVPAAHYICGGIMVDYQGNSDIANLYACGETACTGVHGANRLASNSLLEAIVFSYRAALDAAVKIGKIKSPQADEIPDWDESGTHDNEEWILLSHNMHEIQSVMWDYVGIVRSNLRLHRALRRIDLLEKEIETFYKKTRITPQLLELRNIVTISRLIITSALRRKESRGLHYTTDHPKQDDRYWKKNTVVVKKATFTAKKISM